MLTVLLAESDRELRDAYHRFLSRHGFHIETADDGLACLAQLRRFVPDLLILDLELPWGGGDGVLGVLHEDSWLHPGRVVFTSVAASRQVLHRLASPLIVEALTKPFPLSALLDCAFMVADKSAGQLQEN